MKLFLLAVVAAGLILGARCITIRKDLVSERQTIEADWAQVNTALEARAALIPDLTHMVLSELPADGPAAAAAAAVTDARNALSAAPGPQEKIPANARLDEGLARLMLLIEAHPKVDRSKNYGDMLEALKNAEYQIAVARRKYNEAVEHYNARIEVFPDNMVSSVWRLGKIDTYFQTLAP